MRFQARRHVGLVACALVYVACAKKFAGFPDVYDGRGDASAQVGDDGGGPACPIGGCATQEFASFHLSCAPNDLTSVVASGPCSAPDASVSQYTLGSHGSYVVVGSAGPGTCHVQLTFATGFTYSTDVTFALRPLEGPPGCPGCPPYLGPSPATFMVDNPAETCGDAGLDGSAATDADVFDGDAGPPCGDQPACAPPFETCVTGPVVGAECCHVVSDDSGLVLASCRPCVGDACAASTMTADASVDALPDAFGDESD